MVSLVDAPEKGRRPADISYITTPSEKISVRWSTSRPSACSGLMYWTVPMTTPGSVFRTVGISLSMGAARCAATFASPKSSTLAWRSEEHTSELQSPYDLVCRLLLEKKHSNPHRPDRSRLHRRRERADRAGYRPGVAEHVIAQRAARHAAAHALGDRRRLARCPAAAD